MKKTIVLLLVAIFFCGCSKPGTIEGVVTYFFNDYQGDKPDIGAVVYATQTNVTDIENFLRARNTNEFVQSEEASIILCRSNIKSYEDLLKSPYATEEKKNTYKGYIAEFEERIKSQEEFLQNYEKVPEKEFNDLASKALKNRFAVERDDNVISANIDATGRYSLQLPKGNYNIVFISKGRQKTNLLEVSGQIKIESVTVKPESVHNVSVNFKL